MERRQDCLPAQVMPVFHGHGDRFMSMQEVLETVPACRASIYIWMKDGRFPRSRKYGARRVGFLASEIAAWLQSRKAA
jgi:prophage regulatory protein